MKKLLFIVSGLIFAANANAADVSVYYSPTCPHCHHALEFINNELVYEYQNVKVDAYNVGSGDNIKSFESALKKCNYTSGGVPVIVVGEKCFQGYADFMKQDLRDAVAVDLNDADKKAGVTNAKALAANPAKFRADHTNRKNIINERVSGEQKKNSEDSAGSQVIYFYGLVALLVLGAVGFVLFKRKKK